MNVADLGGGSPEGVDEPGVRESPALDQEVVGSGEHELARPVEKQAVGGVHVPVGPTLELEPGCNLLEQRALGTMALQGTYEERKK